MTGSLCCTAEIITTLQINYNKKCIKKTHKAMWNYKWYIFIRCRTEYEVKDQAAKGDEVTRKRFHAFVLFLGELYLNLEVRFSSVQYWQSLRIQTDLNEWFVFILVLHNIKNEMGKEENNVSVPPYGSVLSLMYQMYCFCLPVHGRMLENSH